METVYAQFGDRGLAIAAGARFLLSKMRADKMAWRLGLFPAIAGVAAGLFAKR